MAEKNIPFWTDEQYDKYYRDNNVEPEDIKSWSCGQLVMYVHHEFNQKSTAMCGYSHLLSAIYSPDKIGDKYLSVVASLESALKDIRLLSEAILQWYKEEPVDSLFTHGLIQPKDIETWTCINLISFIYKELEPKLNSVQTDLDSLASQRLSSNEQVEILQQFQAELDFTRKLNETMGYWLGLSRKL